MKTNNIIKVISVNLLAFPLVTLSVSSVFAKTELNTLEILDNTNSLEESILMQEEYAQINIENMRERIEDKVEDKVEDEIDNLIGNEDEKDDDDMKDDDDGIQERIKDKIEDEIEDKIDNLI